MNFTHKGKALVIGGSSGMGLATAKLLVDNDIEVIIVGRNAEKLELALAQLNKLGKVSAIQVELLLLFISKNVFFVCCLVG